MHSFRIEEIGAGERRTPWAKRAQRGATKHWLLTLARWPDFNIAIGTTGNMQPDGSDETTKQHPETCHQHQNARPSTSLTSIRTIHRTNYITLLKPIETNVKFNNCDHIHRLRLG